MNWISNVVRPRIRSFLTTKREIPDNLWIQCPESGQMVFHKDLEANQFVVPGSNFHMRVAAEVRLNMLFDDGQYTAVELPEVPADPLKFKDGRRYTDRMKDARAKTGMADAVLVGEGRVKGRLIVAAAQDFRFMGGSLGMAAGEAVIAGMTRAVDLNTPFILFAASGGARMQEGILSLMQMPRTTIAVQRLRDAGLPYIVVMTDPTTGGVTASYAMLGDVHIAEPGALICFAGPRVIEQTIREKLPEGFQRAEYLLEHGMVDMVVHRHELRDTLARLCGLLGPQDGDVIAWQEGVRADPGDLAPPLMIAEDAGGSGDGGLNANGHDPSAALTASDGPDATPQPDDSEQIQSAGEHTTGALNGAGTAKGGASSRQSSTNGSGKAANGDARIADADDGRAADENDADGVVSAAVTGKAGEQRSDRGR